MTYQTKPVIAFVAAIFLAISLAVLLFPLELEVTPARLIQAVDLQGKPVQGYRIEEQWAWWGIEFDFHRDVATTDANGLVHFDRHVIQASRLRRFLAEHPVGGVEGTPKHGPVVWFSCMRESVYPPAELSLLFGKDISSGALKIRCGPPGKVSQP
ncbi:MAG TPA: hypothetical protein VK738_05490 [Terriglobales bacterium]|nr:hypothetical protein [Terriglobales bacterium]